MIPRNNPSLTTGQVARVCRVAPRTASKWIDSGRLKGYHVPGSADRRVLYEDLRRFIDEHGLPNADLSMVDPNRRLLVVGSDSPFREQLGEQLETMKDPLLVAKCAESTFEAGTLLETFRPDCVLVDAAIGHIEAAQIARTIRSSKEHSGIVLVALADMDLARHLYVFDQVYSVAARGVPWIAAQIQSLITKKKDRRFPQRKPTCSSLANSSAPSS